MPDELSEPLPLTTHRRGTNAARWAGPVGRSATGPVVSPTRETTTSPLCRFEVIVQDNDRNRAPSMGDSFSIQLSNLTALTSEFTDPTTVPYARAGLLSSGNITVD